MGGGAGADVRNLKRLLKALDTAKQSAMEDGGAALFDTLSQLCDLITYSGDDQLLLAGFSPAGSAQHLTDLLQLLESPDPSLQLMTAKILTQVFEQVPPCIATAVQHGAAAAFTEKLLTIEYMDVAEQAIAALEHVALYYPGALLPYGTLGALLGFLDFFPQNVQRMAVRTVAHLCMGPLMVPGLGLGMGVGGLRRRMMMAEEGGGGSGSPSPSSSAAPSRIQVAEFEGPFLDAAPALTQLLHHSESAVVESAALALLRALQCFVDASDGDAVRAGHYAEGLAAHGVLQHAMQLLAQALPEGHALGGGGGGALVELSASLVELLLRLLGLLARYSPLLCAEMVELGLPMLLQGILANEAGASPDDWFGVSFDSSQSGGGGGGGVVGTTFLSALLLRAVGGGAAAAVVAADPCPLAPRRLGWAAAGLPPRRRPC